MKENEHNKAKKDEDYFHTMKSHLSVIYGYIQLLQQQLETGSNELRWADKAAKCCDDLKKTIEEANEKYKKNS